MAVTTIGTLAIEMLLGDFNTRNIKTKLIELPALIRASKQTVNEARQEADAANTDRQTEEANLLVDILAEVDAKGKPVFSNAESRAAELTRQKANPRNDDYQVAAEAARSADMAWKDAQADLERLIDEYKSYRYIARLTAAEMELIADCTDKEAAVGSDDEEVF